MNAAAVWINTHVGWLCGGTHTAIRTAGSPAPDSELHHQQKCEILAVGRRLIPTGGRMPRSDLYSVLPRRGRSGHL